MLRFLLLEHLSPAIAEQLTAGRPDISSLALKHWHSGSFLSADDATILNAAFSDGLALVTYDLRTIAPLLRSWTEQGVHHGGVVFIHRHFLRPSDVGGILRALEQLWDAQGTADWVDKVVFLQT